MDAEQAGRAYFEAYDRRDWNALRSLLAENVVFSNNGVGGLLTSAEVIAQCASTYETFPDLRTEATRFVPAGEYVTVEWRSITAPSSSGGATSDVPLTIPGVDLIRVDPTGQIVEIAAYMDVSQVATAASAAPGTSRPSSAEDRS